MALNDVSLQVLIDLAYANALSCFNISKNVLIANLSNLYNFASLFKGLNYIPNSYNSEKYSNIDIPLLILKNDDVDFLKKEYELLGVYFQIHPLIEIKNSLKIKCSDIASINKNGVYVILGKITQIEKKKTKKGNDYVVLSIEDETSNIRIYEYKNMLDNYGKNDVILLNITKKDERIYINNIKKMEELEWKK